MNPLIPIITVIFSIILVFGSILYVKVNARKNTALNFRQKYPKVLFGTDAAMYQRHGSIVVSSKKHGYNETEIDFVFNGLQAAPLMTPEVFLHVWKSAELEGMLPIGVSGFIQHEDHVPVLSQSADEVNVFGSNRGLNPKTVTA